jgi:hypothetical protein
MNCCNTSSSDTKPGFLRRHAGLLMCVAVLGLAFFMYSRTDASASGWTWLIALLCPAVHLWMCHRMLKPAAAQREAREPLADRSDR